MIGKKIAHYTILEKLGEGGMGVVYKAEDSKLKRTVALKFLTQALVGTAEEKERFVREAQISAALDHANICTVYEIGDSDGQFFIAMAYIRGEDLADKIKSGPLKQEEILEWAIQIAAGLVEAHEKGIIHRDIKSLNIMITEKGQAKIMDFGLARHGGRSMLTREGTTLGTISYMSPEQTRGENVSNQSDIWAYGVMLYEMITGQLPFKGDYDQAVIYSILNEDPEPITGLRHDISPGFEHIIKKALAKDPDERFQSFEEILEDLKEIKSGKISKPVKKKPERKLSFTLPKISIKHVTALILTVIIIIALFIPWPDLNERYVTASIAVLPFTDLSPQKDQEYFCDGMTEDILTRLSKLGELKVIARTSVMRFKNSNMSVKDIGIALGVENVLEGSVRREGENIRVTAQLINVKEESHIWAENYNKKFSGIFDLQEDLSTAIARKLHVELTPNQMEKVGSLVPEDVLAYEYYLRGMNYLNKESNISEFENSFRNATGMFGKGIEIDSTYALNYVGMGQSYIRQFDFSAYQNQKALSLAKKNFNHALRLNPYSAEAQNGIGIISMIERDFDSAYQRIMESLQINPNNAETLFSAGMLLRSRGLFEHSINYFSKVKELDPFRTSAYTNLAQDLIHLGDLDEVPEILIKAKKMEPEFVPIHSMETQLAILTENYDLASAIISEAEKFNPQRIALEKALLYAALGEKEKALAFRNLPVFYMVSAEVYALLGMKEDALNEILYNNEWGNSHYYYLNLISNPLLDNLRADPRFIEILAKEKIKYDDIALKYKDLSE